MSDEKVPCPECGEDFPDDVVEGDGCDGCGALYLPEEDEVDGENDVEAKNG